MESGFCVSVESLVPLRGWPSRINRDKQWLPEKELGSVCECWRSLCWGWPCRAGHGASGWCDLAARATAAPLHPAASLCRESSAGEQECFWSLLCWGLQKHFKKNLKKKKRKEIEGQFLKCALNWCSSTDFSEVTEIYTNWGASPVSQQQTSNALNPFM